MVGQCRFPYVATGKADLQYLSHVIFQIQYYQFVKACFQSDFAISSAGAVRPVVIYDNSPVYRQLRPVVRKGIKAVNTPFWFRIQVRNSYAK